MPRPVRHSLLALALVLAAWGLVRWWASRAPAPTSATSASAGPAIDAPADLDDAPWRGWRITARLGVRNPGPTPITVRARVPLPVSDPRQQVQVEATSPAEIGRPPDAAGNPTIESRLEAIAPGETRTMTLRLHVRTRHQVVDVDAAALPEPASPPPDVAPALLPAPGLPSRDPAIEAQVRALLGSERNPWYRALRLYDFVRGLKFEMASRPRDVLEVLRTRTAQCSDATALYVTLCRGAGLPARYQSGIYLTEDARVIPETHAWAELWIPGPGWTPADPTMGRFDESLRLSRLGALVPEYVRLATGMGALPSATVEAPATGAPSPTLSLDFAVEPLPGESGGASLARRFPVPCVPPAASPSASPAAPDDPVGPEVDAVRRLLAAGRIPEARTRARDLVRRHPAEWAAWSARLDIPAPTTGPPGILEEARAAPPWIARSVEGALLARQGRWGEAQAALSEAVALHASSDTHANLGRFFLQTRQVSKALGEYSMALVCNPRNRTVHQDLVSLYVALEAWEGVAGVALQAQALFPSVVDFPLSAGQALHRLGQHEKAREAFKGAIRLAPRDGWLHAMLGWTLKELHAPGEALREIELGLELGIPGPERAFFQAMVRDLRARP